MASRSGAERLDRSSEEASRSPSVSVATIAAATRGRSRSVGSRDSGSRSPISSRSRSRRAATSAPSAGSSPVTNPSSGVVGAVAGHDESQASGWRAATRSSSVIDAYTDSAWAARAPVIPPSSRYVAVVIQPSLSRRSYSSARVNCSSGRAALSSSASATISDANPGSNCTPVPASGPFTAACSPAADIAGTGNEWSAMSVPSTGSESGRS